jgi:glycosyltransferase involved in cell wall biosynthesis
MTIWVVNHYADPPDGLATRSYDLAHRMVERGHSVAIFASSFSHYHFRHVRRIQPPRFWETENIDGVRFVWVYTTPYRFNDWRRVLNMVSFAVFAVLAAAFNRERPDVVIGVSVHPLAALAGYVIARMKRSRFLFEVTDLWPQTLIAFGQLKPNSTAVHAMRSLERFLYRRAERIVMLWRHTEAYVESQGVSPDKVVWLPHGVELARYESLRPYSGARERPFNVMFLGGFAASNAIGNIVSAAALLQQRGRKDIRFLLVGAGTNRDEIIRTAREACLENVEFRPPVPKRAIARAMSDADAFIYGLRDLPLYKYGPSLNKLTDYLAGGRPVIFYGNSTYDPVTTARAGYSVPPENPAAVADAIERLVALSTEERVEMGRRGREYVEEYHNIPRLAEKLMQVLGASSP